MLSFAAQNVLLGASLLGVIGGILGAFALLRRQSLIGDALAHTALPGVCLGYLLTGSKTPAPLLLGAMVAGVLGSLFILGVVRSSRVSEDSAIGIVLSVFFGFGIVLLTHIQRLPFGNQSGLDKFLFGQAATLLPRDIAIMAVLGGGALLCIFLLYKEFKVLTFDREYAASLGFHVRGLEILLTLLIVVVVVIGLQTVGVVLIIATLITPAAAARQWTDRFGGVLLLSGAIGGASGSFGALVSASVDRVPTGPAIVLASSAVLVASLLFAPGRGLLWTQIAHRRVTRRIQRENLLKDLYRWGERHGNDWSQLVSWPDLMGERGATGGAMSRTRQQAKQRGWIDSSAGGARLTGAGLRVARSIVRRHRLWELYLTQRLELPDDHVHRDAEDMEHVLDDALVERIDQLLGHPETDPHGQMIPRPAGEAA
ncbi:MAG: iron chelate uptake ABC transporter family permease subunit [Acidobacteriota bacterium]